MRAWPVPACLVPDLDIHSQFSVTPCLHPRLLRYALLRSHSHSRALSHSRSNRIHAADVLQTLHVLVTRSGMLPGYVDPLTQLALYVAAVGHDLEHLGLTNDFLINTDDPLAIRYNDRAPMEVGGWRRGPRWRLLLPP